MTLMQRIGRAGQGLESGWDDGDVERVWQGLKRKRRRRAIAAAGAASLAGFAALAIFALAGREAGRRTVVGRAGRSAPQASRAELTRFADGSTAASSGGHEASLAVVEDTPRRIVIALAKGGARFDVVPRPERVFSVRAGEVTVSVLGTAFSVERVADRVGVAVTRGAVLVDWGVGTRRLAAGEEGWFPPLLVAPPARRGEEHAEATEYAEATVKETPRARRDAARSDLGPAGTIARRDAPGDAPGDAPNAETPPVEAIAGRVSGATARERDGDAPPPAPVRSTIVPVQRDRTPAVGEESGPARLLVDADRARLAGRFEEGASLLQRLLREHPGDQRAPIAAFSLGRVLLGELGRPAEAARAFERARALAPDGPLAEDALAREVEAWSRAGDPDRARARAAEYLRAYPDGRRAAAVTDAVRSNR